MIADDADNCTGVLRGIANAHDNRLRCLTRRLCPLSEDIHEEERKFLQRRRVLEVLTLRISVIVQLHEPEVTALLYQVPLDHELRCRTISQARNQASNHLR